jgi:hypothetical protein
VKYLATGTIIVVVDDVVLGGSVINVEVDVDVIFVDVDGAAELVDPCVDPDVPPLPDKPATAVQPVHVFPFVQ